MFTEKCYKWFNKLLYIKIFHFLNSLCRCCCTAGKSQRSHSLVLMFSLATHRFATESCHCTWLVILYATRERLSTTGRKNIAALRAISGWVIPSTGTLPVEKTLSMWMKISFISFDIFLHWLFLKKCLSSKYVLMNK